MLRGCRGIVSLLLVLALTVVAQPALAASGYSTVEWTDLIPAEDLEALLNPPDSIAEIEDGSPEDMIASQVQAAIGKATDSRYHQALVSQRIIAEFDGRKIRIPGFVVPLQFDDDMVVTEFFIVPYFGACIHLPPPPPNQIIFARFERGFTLKNLYDPLWFEGTVHTEVISNDLGTAAYTMTIAGASPYQEE